MKYTYNLHSFSEKSATSSSGGSNLKKSREHFKRHIIGVPLDTHLIIRKPDNKLMNFYHPINQEILL